MFDGIDKMMQFQTEALKLRGYRQELISANIANSDTPNYKAVDFDFSDALQAATTPIDVKRDSATLMLKNPALDTPTLKYRTPGQASLDGNSVEMDAERAKFADNTVRYEATMRYLSAQIKTMLAALQG